ncbi:hypothetical protein Bhyg_17384, partial [Pseudolycoriella hygida]
MEIPKVRDELDIIQISNIIREEANWSEKINDPIVVAKWKAEIAVKYLHGDQKFDFVLDELGHYVSIKDGSIEVAAVDGTWQSDSLIDSALHDELVSGIALLENRIDEVGEKEWFIGPNRQVLDLVCPSMFCYVAGKTAMMARPVTQQCTKETSLLWYVSTAEIESAEQTAQHFIEQTKRLPSHFKSMKFQWLPTEFVVTETGAVRIDCYINNLHPEHDVQMYETIENIFQKCLPMFSKVLTDLRNPTKNRITMNDYCFSLEDEVEEQPMNSKKCRNSLTVPRYQPPPSPTKIVSLNGRTLQVVVKISGIYLTPDNPEFSDDQWHFEGTANERIVASAIYFYSSENITESRINFRKATCKSDVAKKAGGLYDFEDDFHQYAGSIITQQGRCIAFPNTLQQMIVPFGLEDSTRNGHSKILAFFLVDPTVEIMSTSNVPPQQEYWYEDDFDKELSTLSTEALNKIIESMKWTMSLYEARMSPIPDIVIDGNVVPYSD